MKVDLGLGKQRIDEAPKHKKISKRGEIEKTTWKKPYSKKRWKQC